MKRVVAALSFALGATLIACAGDVEDRSTGGEGSLEEQSAPLELDQIFADAAAEFDVPADLLAAIGYAETRWTMVVGTEEFDGVPAAHGVMALRGENLVRGAQLAGVSEDEVRTDAGANVRAAAALLSELADELAFDRADLGAWAPAVAALSGIEDAETQYAYVAGEVYRALNEGAQLELEDGFMVARVRAREVVPSILDTGVIYAAGPDYAPAIWRPSPNFSSRPAGNIGKVGMVVIHTCEGNYAGCWGWLRNSAAGASAHYVVSNSGSEITQLVRESARAWHVAAAYECSRNGNVECWRNGNSSNHFSVGIEHGGFASQASFPNGQIEASAKLTCDITKGHGIPRDRNHIVAHGRLQPWNRTDPGPNWPWTHYIERVRAHCGDGGGSPPPGPTPTPTPGGSIIVDSNNANNDAAKAKAQVSASWASSAGTPGYYGSGYWWASTEAISDGAEFWFFMPAAGARTVDAWWTAGTNRSTATPFVAFNAAGAKLGSVTRNQRVDGGRWVALGTYNFTAGWNKVVVSRWAAEGSVVVADAIRVR